MMKLTLFLSSNKKVGYSILAHACPPLADSGYRPPRLLPYPLISPLAKGGYEGGGHGLLGKKIRSNTISRHHGMRDIYLFVTANDFFRFF